MKRFIAILLAMAMLSVITGCSTYNYTERVVDPNGQTWVTERSQSNDETGKYIGETLKWAVPIGLGVLAAQPWRWHHGHYW